jgi:hypothetical protein
VSCDYDISCDGCGTVIDGSSLSFAAARRKIREAGGRVNLPGGKDLCPACVKAGNEPE